MRPLPKRPSSFQDDTQAEKETVVQLASPMDEPVSRKNGTKRKVLVGASLIALISVGGFVYSKVGLNSAVALPIERLAISDVTVSEFSEFVPVNGNIVPLETVFLDTVEGGRVTQVFAEAGEVVSAGEPMAALRNTDLELQIMGQEARYTEQVSALARTQIEVDQNNLRYDRQIADARLQIDLTKAALERRLPREKTGVPLSEIERLQTELRHQEENYQMLVKAKARDGQNADRNLEQLKGSVGRMRDGLEILRSSLDGLTISAPIDGQISTLDIKVGEVVAPGARIGQVDQVESYKVTALVDEYYLGRLSVGQSATAINGGTSIPLTITKVYPNIENRRFEIELAFDSDAPENARRGQSLRLRVALGDPEPSLTLPNGAFYEDTGGLWAYVMNADGKAAERREITLGRRNPDRIEVLAGLEAGDRVLTSSYSGFENVTRINLKTN